MCRLDRFCWAANKRDPFASCCLLGCDEEDEERTRCSDPGKRIRWGADEIENGLFLSADLKRQHLKRRRIRCRTTKAAKEEETEVANFPCQGKPSSCCHRDFGSPRDADFAAVAQPFCWPPTK